MKFGKYLLCVMFVMGMVHASQPDNVVYIKNSSEYDGSLHFVVKDTKGLPEVDKEIAYLPKDGSEQLATVKIPAKGALYFKVDGWKSKELTAKDLPAGSTVTFTYKHGKKAVQHTISKGEAPAGIKSLTEENALCRKALSDRDKRIEELESINKQLESIKVSQGAVYLKGSNITQRL